MPDACDMTLRSSSVEDLLAKLISFPTICRTPNVELIDWVALQLSSIDAVVEKLPGSEPGKASLVARIGPDTTGGVAFSAHSDVVPVEGQPWTSDPFVMIERDNKLVGRGTSDMKGFLACMLKAACHAVDRDRESKLKKPIYLIVSYDEEIGCVGVRTLLKQLQERNFSADACIIGEPTEMQVISGHKGKLAVRVICHGLSAHSSNPARGCNAVLLACELIREVEALQNDLQTADLNDKTYEVPFSTAQIGTIRGGVALNIVPDRCEFEFEMRLLAGSDSEKYVNRIRTEASRLLSLPKFAKGKVEIEVLNEYPGLTTPDDSPFLKTLTSEQGGRISFGTEGGLFQQTFKDLPVVVCGPGSIDRAHKADEWIRSDELQQGVSFLKQIVNNQA